MEYLYVICYDEYVEWFKKSSWYYTVSAKNFFSAIKQAEDDIEWKLVLVSVYREDVPWLE